MKIRHVNSGDHVISSGLIVAEGTAEVQASGTATVILFDSASCIATGQAHVTSRGANNVHLSEDAEGDIGGTSYLESYGRGAFNLRGRARGMAMGESEGYVLDDASITAMGKVRLTAITRGDVNVLDEALVNYTTNSARGGAAGRCLAITVEVLDGIAEQLTSLQAVKNGGRGVSCVRGVVSELERGDLTGALAIINNESDKIRSYDDIVAVLRDAGLWWEIDFSKI